MSVANAYAKALYEAALVEEGDSQRILDQLETQMEGLVGILNSFREMRVALYGPIATAKEKVGVISELAQRMSWNPLLKKFLILLANKGRLPLVEKIRTAFSSVRLVSQGGVLGTLEAAEPISEGDVEGLAQAFSKKLGKRVAFRVSTDPFLLAGMKVTVNGTTYDGTLRSQLQKLRDLFLTGTARE